ncbi:hypothetical protein V8E36_004567 [Tilletia maclaganii]
MAIPTAALLWTTLNLARLLSISATFLVFISTITSMVADGRGVSAAQAQYDSSARAELSSSGCDYWPGTDVPLHVWGPFWSHLNRTFELILLVFCMLSEINWGGKAELLFSYTLPILSRSFGTIPLGVLQAILACSNLSHDLGRFPLVTNWILFVVGLINVLLGAIFKAQGKNLRSFHASRRGEAISAEKSGVGPAFGAEVNKEAGLPFVHSHPRPASGERTGGIRQLRYVKDTAPGVPATTTNPAQADHYQSASLPARAGAAVINRPSQAFTSVGGHRPVHTRGAGVPTATTTTTATQPRAVIMKEEPRVPSSGPPNSEPLAASEIYLYDSETERIRMPSSSRLPEPSSAGPAQARDGYRATRAAATAGPAQQGASTTLAERTRSSHAYKLAKAVVARAEQLARSRIGGAGPSSELPTANKQPSSKTYIGESGSHGRVKQGSLASALPQQQRSAHPGPVRFDTTTRMGEYGQLYNNDFGPLGRGGGQQHLRQRSSVTLQGGLLQPAPSCQPGQRAMVGGAGAAAVMMSPGRPF